MVDASIRNLVLALLRYSVGYPLVATGGTAVANRHIGFVFDDLLFCVFAVAAIVTGFGAMGGSSLNSTQELTAQFGGRFTATR